jgi:hypothetical protein
VLPDVVHAACRPSSLRAGRQAFAGLGTNERAAEYGRFKRAMESSRNPPPPAIKEKFDAAVSTGSRKAIRALFEEWYAFAGDTDCVCRLDVPSYNPWGPHIPLGARTRVPGTRTPGQARARPRVSPARPRETSPPTAERVAGAPEDSMLVSLSLTSTTSSVASFEESMLTREQIAKHYNLQAAAAGQQRPLPPCAAPCLGECGHGFPRFRQLWLPRPRGRLLCATVTSVSRQALRLPCFPHARREDRGLRLSLIRVPPHYSSVHTCIIANVSGCALPENMYLGAAAPAGSEVACAGVVPSLASNRCAGRPSGRRGDVPGGLPGGSVASPPAPAAP